MNSKTVINLATGAEYIYSENVSDLFSVCNAYCLNNKKLSWFLSQVQDRKDYTNTLPITIGNQTIACGDYCIIKTDKPELQLYK